MNFLKVILVSFAVLIFMGSNAQLTTQKKIVSRLNTINGLTGSKTFDLKANGTLVVLNFVRDSLSYYSLPDFAVKRGTYLARLDNNFDTLWTKVIYNLYTTDCIFNKSDKIILLGKKYALNGSQLQCGLNLLKLDLDGNQIISVYYNNEYPCSFNNTSYYYETGSVFANINEYRDNAYIVFYNGFLKFNDNFDLVDKKLYNSVLPTNNFIHGNSFINLNDSTLAAGVFSTNAFPGSPYIYYKNAILIMDTQMTIKQYFKVDNALTYLGSLNNYNNKLFFSGSTIGLTGTLDGLTLLGSIDLNNLNIAARKRIIRFKEYYSVNSGGAGLSQFTIHNNKLYNLRNGGYYGNVNDSTGLNNRKYLYCFDTALNIIWSKRLHLFNAIDSLSPDTYNGYSGLSTNKKSDFIFKSNKIIISSYDYQEVYNAGSYFKRANLGFNFSSIDTTGDNALCNATPFNSYMVEDSLGFQNLPIPSVNTSALPQFIPNTIAIQNFQPQQVVQKCLPIKSPKSKFLLSVQANEAVCVNTNVNAFEYSYNEPETWQWIFPPQADVSTLNPLSLPFVQYIRFTQAGVFPIKLVTTNAAGTDTATQYITVINFIPQPNLGNDTTICNGDSVRLIYHDPPYSQHYFTGPNVYTTSDTLIIKDSGQYILAAYTACGYLYDTINVNFIFKPTAKFGYAATCNSLTVAFTDSSKLNGNPGITWQYAWKPTLSPPTAYTDYSTQPNNSFTFAAYDSFDVRLIVKSTVNSCGQQADTIVKRIVLAVKPVAAFTVVTNCGSLQASFTSAATIAIGTITQQQYYVGNTLIGTGASFTYNFASYGSYIVKQVVKSNFNCISDTFLLPVIIKDKPVANLTTPRDSVCNNNGYTITANATVNGSTITSYVWLKNNVVLPNNTNSLTETNPTGTYTYKLVATSALGCPGDTAIKTITVVSKPTVALNATNNCGSKQIAITSSAAVVNDNISNHYISYGDGNTSGINPNNTTYTYASYGTYNIKYAVQSSIGCASDTAYQTIAVRDKFDVNIGYSNNACQNTNYVLTATASAAAGIISNYTWFKNGVLLPVNSSTITENNLAGSYTYKLVAASASSCISDTAIQVVTVENYPAASFTAANNCVGQTISITNNSAANNPTATYLWTTSDGQTSTAVTPDFTFNSAGIKTIQLKLSSPTGACVANASQTITVDAYPVAAFDITEACIGQNIIISNNSTGTIASYAWQTSNAQQSSSVVPQFIFNTAGNYSIKLDVATANNCLATLTKTTPIKPPLQLITRPMVDTNINVNQPVQLNITGGDRYSWMPLTNLTNANINNPVFKSAVPGIYPFTVQATTAQGCKATASLTIKVFAAGNYLFIPNAFTPNGDGKNDQFSFTCAGLQSLSFFRIYNRYGQIVYQQSSCGGNGWDGSFGGKAQPGGAYVYNWQGVAFNGQTVSGQGTVLLVK